MSFPCSNMGWLYYGYLKNDWTLITVNSIGATLQTLYLLAYLFYAAEKRCLLYQILFSLGVLLVGYSYFHLWVSDVTTRLNQLGLFCSIFAICMYLSPLTDLVIPPLPPRRSQTLSCPTPSVQETLPCVQGRYTLYRHTHSQCDLRGHRATFTHLFYQVGYNDDFTLNAVL
ncbi:hypothetical protein FKM82_016358 [Ascaphus truei]